MLKTSISDARKNLSEIVNKVCYSGERAVIGKHNKECAAIVTMQDLELIEHIEQMIELHNIREGLAEAEAGETVDFLEMMKELGIDPDNHG